MRVAVAFKWQAYGLAKWRRMLLVFVLYFATYIASVFMLHDVQEKLDNGESNEWLMYYHWLAIAIFGVTSVINAMHGWGEVKELLAQGPQDYFSSTQNWLDIAQFLNVLLLGPLVVTGSPVARVTGSIGTVLMLPKMAMVARGHERMSALVMVLLEIPKDIKPFLGLMTVVIVANAFAFELLSEPGGEYSGPLSAWITAYSLIFGEFDKATYSHGGKDEGSSLLMLFFFHYFTLFVNIVLLNVLIAIISDSYERVQEKFKARSLLQRAQLLLEMEEVMSEQELEDPKLFPAWCHVLTRAEDDNGVDAWSGRLHAIKEQVTRIESKLKDSLFQLGQEGKNHTTQNSLQLEARMAHDQRRIEDKVDLCMSKVDMLMGMLESTLQPSLGQPHRPPPPSSAQADTTPPALPPPRPKSSRGMNFSFRSAQPSATEA